MNNSFALPADLKSERKILSGWGKTKPVNCQVVKPDSVQQLQALIKKAPSRSLIARGLGRSYGDAAQLDGGTVIELPLFDRIVLDSEQGIITAGSGVTLDQILRLIVPQGFFLPVTPGTRNVTVGGAIAADVHGKNHHIDGSFGNFVKRLLLIDSNGDLQELKPCGKDIFKNAELFWTTIGGMGLTGVIVEATFSLIPISSSLISVNTSRYQNLESLMAAMLNADVEFRYSVAWVDSLDKNGRGVLTTGEHAEISDLLKDQQIDPLFYDPKAIAKAPKFFPAGLLNKLTVRAFNEAWYRKAPKYRKGELQTISQFFHPLDGVIDWNRIYGPLGFLQYQFAVPDKAAYLIPRTLNALRDIGAPSFLTVLKRLGQGNPSPLSFPIPGWTLAADVPASVLGLFEVLDQLDEEVAAAGGRLYLAKDSRQSARAFQMSYGTEEIFSNQAKIKFRNQKFDSDLLARIGIHNWI
tara:strand:- start:422 stop:1822 length:1401 start_codon:yes stop_codon:yes gene_type:complete